MSGIEDRLVQTWLEAARDLGIRVVAPYELALRTGETVLCEAFIPDFGSAAGAVQLSAKNERRVRRALRGSGVWVSATGRKARLAYDRGYYIDMLNDWGWFGPKGRQPDWYTGAPWT